MSKLYYLDSFDHYSISELNEKWNSPGSESSLGVGRSGTGQAFTVTNFPPFKTFGPLLTEVTVGAAFQTQAFGWQCLALGGGPSDSAYIGIQADGRVSFTSRGQTDLSSGYIINQNVWYYMEYQVAFSATTVTYTVRVNEQVILSGTFTSSTVTTPGVTTVTLSCPFGGNTSSYDDLYVTDTEFLGDVHLGVIHPVSPGNSTQWSVPPASGTSYTNPYGSGNRQSQLPVTASEGIIYGGNPENLVNGLNNANLSLNSISVAGAWFQFDFGGNQESGQLEVVVTEATWYQNTTDGWGTWRWQGSNDGITWTDIGSTFTLGAALTQVQTTLNGNTTAYRYYRLYGVSGTGVGPSSDVEGIDFKVSYPQGANWQMVNDILADQGFSLIYAPPPASGSQYVDLYNMEQIPGGAIVMGIQGVIQTQKDADGTATMSAAYFLDETLVASGNFYPSADSWLFLLDPQLVSLFTGEQWTYEEINALQFGQSRLT